MIRTRSLVVLALAVFVPACDGEDDKGGDAKDEDSNAPTPAADRTPLKRRDAPPAGVAEQVSYFSVGNGGCPEGDQPAVRFLGGFPREGQESIGQQFVICLSGFAKGRPVRVSVRRPDGRDVDRQAAFERAYGLHTLSWTPLPGDPLGRHDVTATQGATTAQASFSVRRSPIPRVRPLDDYVPPGRPVRLVLAGFEPRQLVALHLYRARGGSSERFSYLTTINARMDRRGEALYRFPTDPDAPRITYLVRFSKQAQDTFSLDDPPPELR